MMLAFVNAQLYACLIVISTSCGRRIGDDASLVSVAAM